MTDIFLNAILLIFIDSLIITRCLFFNLGLKFAIISSIVLDFIFIIAIYTNS